MSEPVSSTAPTYETILVAVDGSEHAHAAVAHAGMLAQNLGSKLLVLHVVPGDWDEPEFGGEPDEGYNTLDRDGAAREAEGLVQRQIAELAPEVPTEIIVRFGIPDEQILDVADARDVDLIIVGSRGLTGFQRFLLGSVSYKVARSAERPVLVVHI